MADNNLIEKINQVVKTKFSGEGTGHDWHHIQRVVKLSRYIAGREKAADLFLVEVVALLHDLEDWKFNSKKDAKELPQTRKLLVNLGLENSVTQKVLRNISKISFKGTGKNIPPDLEGKIVQDADRLDALGALGIARTFAYGGKLGRPIFDPKIKPFEYFSTSINHFYEKLLLLKNRMNTKTGRKLAADRHKFIMLFLKQFMKEWKGKIV